MALTKLRAALVAVSCVTPPTWADLVCPSPLGGCFEDDAPGMEEGVQLLQVQTQLQVTPSSPMIVNVSFDEVTQTVTLGGADVAEAEQPLKMTEATTARRRYRRGEQFTQMHMGAVALVLSLFVVQLMWVQYCSKKRMEHVLAEKGKAASKALACKPLLANNCADVLSTEQALAMADRELRCVFKDAPCCHVNEWRRYRSQWRMAGQKEEARLHSRVMLLLHGPEWEARTDSTYSAKEATA